MGLKCAVIGSILVFSGLKPTAFVYKAISTVVEKDVEHRGLMNISEIERLDYSALFTIR